MTSQEVACLKTKLNSYVQRRSAASPALQSGFDPIIKRLTTQVREAERENNRTRRSTVNEGSAAGSNVGESDRKDVHATAGPSSIARIRKGSSRSPRPSGSDSGDSNFSSRSDRLPPTIPVSPSTERCSSALEDSGLRHKREVSDLMLLPAKGADYETRKSSTIIRLNRRPGSVLGARDAAEGGTTVSQQLESGMTHSSTAIEFGVKKAVVMEFSSPFFLPRKKESLIKTLQCSICGCYCAADDTEHFLSFRHRQKVLQKLAR